MPKDNRPHTALSGSLAALSRSFRAAGDATLRRMRALPRPHRRHLAALAPLMATTALVAGDALPQRPSLEQPAWSHATLSAQDFRLTGGAVNAGQNVLPARCYTPQPQEQSPLFNRDDSSWRGFYVMSRGGVFTRGLHGSALALEMAVCESASEETVRNFDASSRVAGISEETTLATNIREATHGIVHALMQQNNLSTPAADEALFSRLSRHLTGEAVAVVAEYVVAAEQNAGGDNNLIEELRASRAAGYAYFEQRLTDLRRTGRTTDTAIAQAASETISYLVRQPEFIAANSDVILTGYVAELARDGGRPRRTHEFERADARRMGQIGRAAIANDVQLLTPQELAAIAPQTASVLEALQTLHARRNNYPAPRTYVAGNVYADVTVSALQQQFANSNNIYTAPQAFERARNARTNSWTGRAWQMQQTFTSGMQADFSLAQTPVSARPLWQQLDAMRRLSPTFGPGMAEIATQSNVVMCYGPLRSTLLGEWQPDAGIIVLNGGIQNIAGNTRTLAHELLHMMQHAHGIGSHYRDVTLGDIQMSSLTRESAASVISILVAMEFKLYGDDSLWNLGDDQARGDRMMEVYRIAREGGATHQASLEAAGLEGYKMMFERQWWLDTYNNTAARYVVGRLADNWLRAPSHNRYPLDSIRQSGKVSDSFNFTRGIDAAPDDRMLFGTNTQMRQLYDYLEWQQLRQTRGERHADTRAQRSRMQQQNNPYLNVDFAQLSARVAADSDRSVLDHINCLANGTCAELRPPAASPRTPTCAA